VVLGDGLGGAERWQDWECSHAWNCELIGPCRDPDWPAARCNSVCAECKRWANRPKMSPGVIDIYMDVIADEHLVMSAKRSGGDAFGMLYERDVHAIFRYVMIRIGSRREAKDLVESIFLKAWHSLDSFWGRRTSFRTCWCSIPHNALIDHYRCRKRERGLDEAQGAEVAPAGPAFEQ
jgi:hypothetical protein